MYELFRPTNVQYQKGAYTPQSFSNVNRYVQDQYEKIKKFYFEYPALSASDGLLGKIINDFRPTARLDWPRIYDSATNDIFKIAGVNGMVSAMTVGGISTRANFLGLGEKEIYVALQFPIDLATIDSNWTNLQPVRWLQHDSVDINMPLLGSRQAKYLGVTGTLGYGVIAVDIAMLAVQYQYWRYYHSSKSSSGKTPNIGEFIGGIVLPNMVPSFHNIALFNRLANLIDKKSNPTVGRTHSFAIYNLGPHIDNILNQAMTHTTKKRLLTWNEVYGYMPSFFNKNLFTALSIPTVPNTRQMDWVLDLARLPMIGWSLKNIRKNNLYSDQSFINAVRYDIKQKTFFKNKLKLDYYRVERYIDDNIVRYLNSSTYNE